MASSSSSSSPSSSSWENPKISREEIKLFHTIDRVIFARLVLNLRRDPGESMHVMALLLWIEHYSSYAGNLIHNIQFWPDTLINSLADEVVQCLNCIKSSKFPFSQLKGATSIIPLIRKLTKNEVSLRLFHDHRLGIIRGMVQLVEDVCVRAFDDILQQALGLINPMTANQERSIDQSLKPLMFSGPLIRPTMPVHNYNNSGVGNFGDQNILGNQQIFRPHTSRGQSGYFHGFDPNDLNLRAQRKTLNNEMEELLNRIHNICINSLEENNNNNNNNNNNIAEFEVAADNNNNDDDDDDDDDDEEFEVAADDRTIFLTFSKGHPISKDEVTDFFIRKFGNNFVQRVEMEQVPAGQQPLYARLVLVSASDLDIILKGLPKAKYSINGKHVWARKFKRRSTKFLLSPYSNPTMFYEN